MRPKPTRGLATNPVPVPPTADPADDAAPLQSKDGWSESFTRFLAETPAAAETGPAAAAHGELALNFRHSGWAKTRTKVHAMMQEMKAELPPRRIAAFEMCGADASVEARQVGYDHKVTEYRIRSTKCHDRFCVPCSNERANRYRTVLIQHMFKRENLKLITLTLKHSDRPLKEILDRITKHFRCLRSKPIWKKNVQGGVWIIETKVGENSGQWNVHVHVVAESKFIPQKVLRNTWEQITGDSLIVDIRPVGAISGAVQYVTKYVTKAADPSITNDPHRLRESIHAFTGRRLVSTFGTWSGLVLSENPDAEQESPPTATPWRDCGTLDGILRRATAGDAESLTIVLKLAPHKFRERPPPQQPRPVV